MKNIGSDIMHHCACIMDIPFEHKIIDFRHNLNDDTPIKKYYDEIDNKTERWFSVSGYLFDGNDR